MTAEQLITEGRQLQRRTLLLITVGAGDAAAMWYGRDWLRDEDEPYRCWISVNGSCIPNFNASGWVSVFTNDETHQGGRVEVGETFAHYGGLPLYSQEISVLPPIDAVIARGSPAVGEWLAANNWKREWRYNNNFRDRAIVHAYEAVERKENPLYQSGNFATLGGWHIGWPDNDWHQLIDAKLLVQTYMDSEPWVEAWQLPSGGFKVIQRIT